MTNGGPVMRRTRWTDLAVPFVIVAITTYVLIKFAVDSVPTFQYLVPVPLAALAAAEFVAARRVRAAVRHDPRAKPMAAIVIARCVALGKASSLVAAGVAGAAVALLTREVPDLGNVRAADHDVTVAALVVAAAVFLAIAGLLLERAGVDPGRDRRQD